MQTSARERISGERLLGGIGVFLILSGFLALGWISREISYVMFPPTFTWEQSAVNACVVDFTALSGTTLTGTATGAELRMTTGNTLSVPDDSGTFSVDLATIAR